MPWSPPASELLTQSNTAAAVMGWTPPDAPIAPVPGDLSPGPRDVVQDYPIQILHGLGRGIAAIPGFGGDIANLLGYGIDWLGNKIAPETNAGIKNIIAPIPHLPTSAQTVGAAERNLIGKRPEPKTAGARFAGNVAQYIPGALLPMGGGATVANLAKQGLLGAASGASAEGARELGLPPAVQVGAGLLPGLLASGVNALSGRTGAAGQIRQALRETTPVDFEAAAARQAAGRAIGVPLMGQEALAPEVGAGPLGALASGVSSTAAGAPKIAKVFEARPAQVTSAVKSATARLGPTASADEVLTSIKDTATRAIEAAKAERTRVTSPLFQAAGKTDIPADAIAPIVSQIDDAIAGAGTGSKLSGALTKLRSQLAPNAMDEEARLKALNDSLETLSKRSHANIPTSSTDLKALMSAVKSPYETNTARLQNIYQELRDSLDDPLMLEGSLRKQSGILRPIAGQIQDALASNNPIYRQANDLYQRMSGPVRALAGEPDNPALIARVANAKSNESLRRLLLDPENISPENVGEIANVFRSQNRLPDLGAFMRHALENEFNSASRQLQSGANPAMGVKFGNAVYGTDKQRALMQSYWNQLDPTGAAGRGLETLFKVTERTGRTPGMGSPTATRLQLGESLGGGPAATAAQLGAGAMMAATGLPAGQLAGGYLVSNSILGQIRRAYLSLGAAKVARILTDPDSVGKLRALARKDPASPAAATAVLSMMGGRAQAGKE